MKNKNVKNKILIVGGSSGLGLHITNMYLKKNYRVSIICRTKNKKFPKKLDQYICDVTKEAKLQRTLKIIKEKHNYFDTIIHNVGGSQKVFDEHSTSKDYLKVWRANFGYIIDINNFFIPSMKKNKWGRIIHVSSSAAYNFTAPVPYSSAKAALNTYVSSISRRLIKDRIVASCICPGPIELPRRFMSIAKQKNNSFWKNYTKNHLPIKRLAKPEEITSVIYFLSSELASFSSGAIWNVDGSEY